MKNIIRRWLNIENKPVDKPVDISHLEERIEKQINRLDWFMREYHPHICDGCGKGFLAHYGGFYRSKFNNGQFSRVYCSYRCLDESKENEQTGK